jgi:mannan endo-1,4-beta-mannosidase
VTSSQPESHRHRALRRSLALVLSIGMVLVVAVVATALVRMAGRSSAGEPSTAGGAPSIGAFSHHHVVITLPARPASYLGAFAKGVPESYVPMETFARDTGEHPNLALYYSGWYESFRPAFAVQAKQHGAVPFIQIDPAGIDFRAIVGGAYDTYLETFATDVASYGATTGQGVIIGFGHEMNGSWFPWGYRHVTPGLFVAAWRHIVDVFRQQGAYDVTWLWTVNIIDKGNGIPSPTRWWPGSSYVTWIGIDGYFLKPSWKFASLFGPTIKDLRALTFDPILVAETGASPAAGQPAKIADLFAGVRAYGLLGFVWFDAKGTQDWRLNGTESFNAFRQGARTFGRSAS